MTKNTAHASPINKTDSQARKAFCFYKQWLDRFDPPLHDLPEINSRTVERIVAGKRDVPPGLARELAHMIRLDSNIADDPELLQSWADSLVIWADDCEARSKGNRHA